MKWRILCMSLAITLVCVLILGFAVTRVYYNSSVSDSKQYLKVYMNVFDGERYSLDEEGALALSAQLGGVRVSFFDGQGNVLADSSAEAVENHADRSEIAAALAGGEGFAVRDSATLGEKMIYYCRSFDGGAYLVRIAIPIASDWGIFAGLLPTMAMYFAVIIAACAVIAFISTHFILTPVERLVRDASISSSLTGKYRELLPIADILNERNRSIERQLAEIEREKELVIRERNSKDEFISNVTHEINTPLTSIMGYAELLGAGGMSEEQRSAAYDIILKQSGRLANLFACIINYSEIDNKQPAAEQVDFSAAVREILTALAPEAEKAGAELRGDVADGVTVLSSRERVSELVGNLVRNAIRYNRRGGSVTVTLRRGKFTVEDTGIGIEKENLDKIFSRFFTVDKSHGGRNGGFGLGLAVVKKICLEEGWKISVESTIGVGSRFTVEF